MLQNGKPSLAHMIIDLFIGHEAGSSGYPSQGIDPLARSLILFACSRDFDVFVLLAGFAANQLTRQNREGGGNFIKEDFSSTMHHICGYSLASVNEYPDYSFAVDASTAMRLPDFLHSTFLSAKITYLITI
ncbi:MAG: hypothetical protein HT580_04500 [Dechloromonas sp.]|nr:MAG: hypothetical protein HT580_04500 [Dechloromonas sp.]